MNQESDNPPERTALYDLHVEYDAKLVPFAGYSMPMNYAGGILSEHRHTRSQASLFDVSHMSRFYVSGPGAELALESVCPADIVNLEEGRLQYTFLTDDSGGIIDDFMLHRMGDSFVIIANAATRKTDHEWLLSRIGKDCDVHLDENYSLLALQGPKSVYVLRDLNSDIDTLSFLRTQPMQLAGIDCFVARSGYTGEDGFEISVPLDDSLKLARRLLANPSVNLAGLGARDGLRLEAGLCLYGQDIDTSTTPIEAGLGWAIAKERQIGGSRAGGFPGAEQIFLQMQNGPSRRRVGLLPDSRAPLRAGTNLMDAEAQDAGVITSGSFSPILERPIACAYIRLQNLEARTKFFAQVRGKKVWAIVSQMPFVPHQYQR